MCSAYLPYGVKVVIGNVRCNIAYLSRKKIAIIRKDGMGEIEKYKWEYLQENRIKLVLRPLSDLANEIEHNGKQFIPWIELEDEYREGYNDLVMEFNPLRVGLRNKTMGTSELVPFELMQKLFEWHIDVFDLHSNGLCIYKDEI